MASILMPNQGAVMLWQSFRSTAISLSATLVLSSRRLKARKQDSLPADVDAEASFNTDVLAVTLPKKPAAQKLEKKIQVQAGRHGRSTEARKDFSTRAPQHRLIPSDCARRGGLIDDWRL
jgi:type IV pilus biogenesis protein CpaD/CtpE